jgi:hypothetical protein
MQESDETAQGITSGKSVDLVREALSGSLALTCENGNDLTQLFPEETAPVHPSSGSP